VVVARTVTEPLNPANTEEPDRFTLPDVPVGVRSGLERIGDGAEVPQSCGLALAEQRTLGQEMDGKRAWGGFAVATVATEPVKPPRS